MKQETLAKATEIIKEIAAYNRNLNQVNAVIKDREKQPSRRIIFGTGDNVVEIYDSKIADIIIAILQSDFQDKLKKVEQEFADLKD